MLVSITEGKAKYQSSVYQQSSPTSLVISSVNGVWLLALAYKVIAVPFLLQMPLSTVWLRLQLQKFGTIIVTTCTLAVIATVEKLHKILFFSLL